MRRGEVIEAVTTSTSRVSDGVERGGDVVSFLRWSAKPIQAVPLHEAYDDLDDDELAISAPRTAPARRSSRRCASCSLARGRPSTTSERPPGGPPAGEVGHNCSGKHAGMLAACRANGWPFAGYRLPDHPV